MKCADVDLISFHFGEVEGEARAALETHLAGCPSCIRAFIALKRDIELGSPAERPSAASRDRLRAAVITELAPRPWHWWERPAAFAAAAVIVLLAMALTFALAAGGSVATGVG